MLPFATAIALGALLLFLVQPMLGKFILPWFGGSPATWTACLLFFQLGLLLAYAYAHALARLRSLRRQVAVHLGLAALAAAQLAWQMWTWHAPLLPGPGLAPGPDGGAPALHVLGLLAASVGLPYLVLGATSPLLQAWFHRAAPGRSPYRLYALSNLGSLAALVAYPFLLEPALGLASQGWVWASAFAVWTMALSASARAALRPASGPAPADPPARAAEDAPPGAGRMLLWIGLAASASLVLAAATNQMTLEVAAGPFLWVLPLGLYLFSFVLAFAEPSRYPRRVMLIALPVVLALSAAALWKGPSVGIWAQVAVWSTCVFACALCCHGELHRLRPAPRHLTAFYLCLSLGGALGGAFASLAAPWLFSGLFELHLGLGATAALVWLALLADRGGPFHGKNGVFARVGAALLALALGGALVAHAQRWSGEALEASRDFYGVLRVLELDADAPALHRKDLFHGLIRHGTQLLGPGRRPEPTTYYGPRSGAGLALQFHPRRLRGEPLRVGLVGLGVGTLAAYGQAGDTFRFYEIQPRVAALAGGAGGHFSFLADCPAEVQVVLGDARLTLARELAAGGGQGYDVLLVDAFSSDSIPVHLLTQQALALYAAHLAPGGVLGLHVTNRHLDLDPVVRAGATPLGWRVGRVDAIRSEATNFSRWMLLEREPALLAGLGAARLLVEPDEPRRVRPWTDDFSNLLGALK